MPLVKDVVENCKTTNNIEIYLKFSFIKVHNILKNMSIDCVKLFKELCVNSHVQEIDVFTLPLYFKIYIT